MPDEVKLAHLGCENCGREVKVRTDQIACPNCGAVLWEDEDCAEMLRTIALRISANIGYDPNIVARDVIAVAERFKAIAAIEATRPTAATDDVVVKELVEALEDVLNPIGRLRRLAEAEGTQLGPMAYSIANDIGYIRSIAREALARTGVTLNG